MKKIRQGLCGENFSSLAGKMAKLAFFILHSGQNWSKVNLKKNTSVFGKRSGKGTVVKISAL